MATQFAGAGGMSVAGGGRRPRSRVDGEPSRSVAIRCAIAAILLVLGMCGVLTTGSVAGARTIPVEGPWPGGGYR